MDREKGGSNPEVVGQKDPLVTEVASKLHDAWREPRRIQGTDQFKSRLKPTSDPVWIEAHGGKTQVDIANTSYEDLPEEWQRENQAAAKAAIAEIRKAEQAGLPLDEAFVEAASDAQHNSWLQRNGSWAPPEQNLPFIQLSEPEKEKDRAVIRTALEVYNDSKGPQAAPRPATPPPAK